MRRLFRWIGRLALLLGVFLVGFWFFGPREPVDTQITFDAALDATMIDAYFEQAEAQFDDITQGTEKRVIWANTVGEKTPLSVLYVHGFSATSEEIRPVPDNVASALGANLVYTRLRGHGRGGEAFATVSAGDWINDTAEALAAARAVGDKVIVIATSTGGTLTALAALDAGQNKDIAGIVFVSPNFGLANRAGALLNWPGARWWGPIVAGAVRSFETMNADHAKYWTTRYPSVAVLPMAALVKHAVAQDYSRAMPPALFLFSPNDSVVSADMTRRIAAAWGGPAILSPQEVPPGNDPYNHVIAGDILSPAMTATVTQQILDWVRNLRL